jgi:hypothetical protein
LVASRQAGDQRQLGFKTIHFFQLLSPVSGQLPPSRTFMLQRTKFLHKSAIC